MDFVILEGTFVGIAVFISQCARSFFLVVFPCAIVYIAFSIRHFSLSVAFVFNIIADISFASGPSKCAKAVFLLVQPLALILMPILVFVLSLLG